VIQELKMLDIVKMNCLNYKLYLEIKAIEKLSNETFSKTISISFFQFKNSQRHFY